MRKFVLGLLALAVIAHPLWAQHYIHPDSAAVMYSTGGVYNIHGRTTIIHYDLSSLCEKGYVNICAAADTVFVPTFDMIDDTFEVNSIYKRGWFVQRVKVHIKSSSVTGGFSLDIKTPPEQMDTNQYVIIVLNKPFLSRPVILGPYYFPIPLDQIPLVFRSFTKRWIAIHVPPKEIGIYPYPPEK